MSSERKVTSTFGKVEFSRKTLQTLDFWRKSHKTKTCFVFFKQNGEFCDPYTVQKLASAKKKTKNAQLCRSCVCFVGAKKWKQKKTWKNRENRVFFRKKTTRSFSLIFEKKWAKVEWIWFDCFCLTVQAKSSQVRQFFAKNTQHSSLFDPQKICFLLCFYDYNSKNV